MPVTPALDLLWLLLYLLMRKALGCYMEVVLFDMIFRSLSHAEDWENPDRARAEGEGHLELLTRNDVILETLGQFWYCRGAQFQSKWFKNLSVIAT